VFQRNSSSAISVITSHWCHPIEDYQRYPQYLKPSFEQFQKGHLLPLHTK
jgi:hypothetical protein